MEEEIWKPVEELPEKYLVSNLGRIKYIGGYRDREPEIIPCHKDSNGYIRINMWDGDNKKYISRTIHYLVARAFISNPKSYPIINHKDENPVNNEASNLEWCTYKYNNDYGTAKKRATITRINKGISKKVFVYDLQGVLINKFDSIYSASKYYNISSANISACCNHRGSSKTLDNLIFRFEGDSWKFEKSNYRITFGIYLDDKLVFKARGSTQVCNFLGISKSCMDGKLHRYRLKDKPMIHKDYKIFILEEK